jgi:hypothetical protein
MRRTSNAPHQTFNVKAFEGYLQQMGSYLQGNRMYFGMGIARSNHVGAVREPPNQRMQLPWTYLLCGGIIENS